MPAAKINKFKINKAPLENNFTQINMPALGLAAGTLKLVGLKLYLYLSNNVDKYEWKLNSAAYATWLGGDIQPRTLNKSIQDGIADLLEHGYLKQIADGEYEFYENPTFQEQFVPTRINLIAQEQKVPTDMAQEQIVPIDNNDKKQEQIVPIDNRPVFIF